MNKFIRVALVTAFVFTPIASSAQQSSDLHRLIDQQADRLEDRVIAWRRDFHANPELGNREFRTAGIVAEHLGSLGLEVRTGVAHTGVVGILRGGRPGPVVMLRADMDGLPVTELVDLPFASKIRTIYNGSEVGVMHACGHDNHVAILMGVAEVMAEIRDQIPGTVKFIFQPAEEGAPAGEEGGANLMLREGAFEDPTPEVAFGLHVGPGPLGAISYRPGGMLASSDGLHVKIIGRQTHGAVPWAGVDPIVTTAQIITGLQTIVSRQVDLTDSPAIVTVGWIRGGNRGNIIPDSVEFGGTIRSHNPDTRTLVHERIRRVVTNIAASAGAEAEVTIRLGYPVTVNDPALTEQMLPTMQRVAGASNVNLVPPIMGAEDFSYFAQEVPGLFVMLGVTPEDQDPATAAANHSPLFFADETALKTGVRTLANLAIDYMLQHRPTP